VSRKRVETVRRVFDDWARGDFRTTPRLFDPQVMMILRPEFPDAGIYVGPDEIASYTRHLLGSWAEFTIAAEDFVEAGDSVVVQVRQRGVGRSSGIATELDYFMAWTFRGDSVIRIESIGERSEALRVVGLSE
jgi:ketosteroid isomerase-like protein